jgi:hypothetical protein
MLLLAISFVSVASFAWLRGTYGSYPLYIVAFALTIILGLLSSIYYVIRLLRGRPTRTMQYPNELVLELRALARQGKGISEMFDAFYDRYPMVRRHSAPLTLFMDAFCLPLQDVIVLNGAEHVGNAAYSDEELDDIVLPLILEARQHWDVDSQQTDQDARAVD